MNTQEEWTVTKSTERKAFLHGVFVTAIEGGVNSWAYVTEYHWSKSPDQEGIARSEDYVDDIDDFYAVLENSEYEWGLEEAFVAETGQVQPIEPTQHLRVDLSVINRGVNILVDKIVAAAKSEDPKADCSLQYLRQFLAAWITDGDDGDYDVIAADLAVQFGLFGDHVYN